MSLVQAIVYGIIQGVGEFLPISSTAHIILLPWLFNWKDPGLAFDVAMHLGTSLAVIVFFFKDWVNLIISGIFKPKTPDGKLFWLIVLATIPAGAIGVLLGDYMDTLRNPILIAITLMLMGIVLYLADQIGKADVELNDIGTKRSFLVGLSQAIALIPGVSRSGITMTAGRLLGMPREAIAKFTFLMSTPIILAGGLFKLKDLRHVPIDAASFATAVLTSAVVGFLSIKFLLDYLKKKGFGIFAVYRIVLGIIIIALYFLRAGV